jgi:hypothetical protein
MTMRKPASRQSTQNREYVRRLLNEKQPGFSAALELAVDLVEWELTSRETQQRDVSAPTGHRRCAGSPRHAR